jgi:pyridoxamine 5'-phosphate oxidase-like protein
MYGISSDSDGLLSWNYVNQEMERSRNYWVVSVRPDGRPHAAPVWGVWVDDALFFGTSDVSVKGRNLVADPRLVVHLESGDDVVIFEGTATREPLEPELHRRIVTAYAAKYDMAASELQGPEGWFRLRATTVLAWHENDFVHSATRWRPT